MPRPSRLRIRSEFEAHHTLGPGKLQLLDAVDECGSISAAARSMSMSYRRGAVGAWVARELRHHGLPGRAIRVG